MDMMRYQKIRDEIDDKHGGVKLKNGGKQLEEPPSSPSSSPSSPNHEFSFTISLHSSSVETAPDDDADKAKSSPPASFAVVDLSPADEIFFHGHLLPLHLLSHVPPVSPRSSTHSLDSFTLKNEMCPSVSDTCLNVSEGPTRFKHVIHDPWRGPVLHSQNHADDNHQHNNYCQRNDHETKTRPTKSNKSSFSLFGLQKWRKNFEVKEKEEKRRLRFVDVSNVLKRYMRMVRPLLTFGRRSKSMHFQKQSHSFSGNTSFRDEDLLRGKRRIQYSAPASMITSPTNSGPLLPSNNARIATATSDSTMEELQAAIQAAIAHCKNSIAMEDNKKEP